ncbi:hypothetical protein EDD68_10960 [Melghiribacillus thermohalophilus]|uniref:Uncharacterized protein n=1 Tax=Melghiribacillus thermohalophilus TaxID=1324956 RepID=A0A4R3N135_9BACI|nr:hypothetical protein [Melghiribacillus thermohalophilus]TCT22414.1 hypothetical protein EDD68_10960 [Melghiribacillus thermohalophilus]
MKLFLMDFFLFAILIVGLTAFLAVIPQKIGESVFGRKQKHQYPDYTKKFQKNWPKQIREK